MKQNKRGISSGLIKRYLMSLPMYIVYLKQCNIQIVVVCLQIEEDQEVDRSDIEVHYSLICLVFHM